jgi:hypothetical protein
MPNICENKAKITASTEFQVAQLKEYMNGLKDPDDPKFLEAIWPTPSKLLQNLSFTLEPPAWYQWRRHYWGTPTDCAGRWVKKCELNGMVLHVEFYTNCYPPLGIWNQLERKGFLVRATWCEVGFGSAGIFDKGTLREYSETGLYSFQTDLLDVILEKTEDQWSEAVRELNSDFDIRSMFDGQGKLILSSFLAIS